MRVPLTNGFQLVPEGTYVFYIYQVDADKDFGKVKIHMVKADGMTYIERFSLKTKDDDWNQGAVNSFSYFSHAALNNFEIDNIDPEDLVGHYIKAEVKHVKVPKRENPDETITFANLGQKEVADGFDEEPSARALKLMGKVKQEKPKPATVDLDSLLD